jgi:hypothetical protein
MIKLGNVLLLGDSYTTFKDHIPEGHAAYYSESDKSITDCVRVEDTWWHRVVSATDSNLVLNNSWSGSTVCNTGYNAADFTDRSFITRLDRLIDADFFRKNAINTVFVLGGTNDSWSGAPIGERIMYEGWEKSDLYSFLPAIGYLGSRLSTVGARVIYIMNTELKPEITEGVRNVAEHFENEFITLSKIDKISGHPGIAGMKKIAEQVLSYLEANS